MSLTFAVGTLDEIEALQIHSQDQASRFFNIWNREIDYIRFELVTRPKSRNDSIAIDLVLRSSDGCHSFIIIGIILDKEMLFFPSIIAVWNHSTLDYLANRIAKELNQAPKNYEVRALHPSPRLAINEMTIERVLPGFRDYTTAVNHIKRYTFLLDRLLPGTIVECACGTGYGASILSRRADISKYFGIDLSPVATSAAHGNVVLDPRFSFHNIDLSKNLGHRFENVLSLETIEHTSNPYQFLELLIEKMAPGGQLLLSLPTETWGGSHRNPYHLSNWTRQRFIRFLKQYFLIIEIHTQRLSLLGPTSFEASEILDSYPNENTDECFVAILSQPSLKKRKTIVLRRTNALGDVIWITPVLRALRRRFPEHNLIVVTNKTEVFINNPDVDLVFSPSYQPAPGDQLIDLDWAYEKSRSLHILQAYAIACGIEITDVSPRLFPSTGQIRNCASIILQHFKNHDINHLIAIHMAASSPDRIWPKNYWKEFIANQLAKSPTLGIIVLGQGKDFKLSELGLDSARALCLVNKLDLMQTAGILAHCDLLVAPDSGLIHVAASMQTPYLGLFGMADPRTRLPLTDGNCAIWSDIPCRGCLKEAPPFAAPSCPKGHAVCMDLITSELVESKVTAMLAERTTRRWLTRVLLSLGQSPLTPSPTKTCTNDEWLEQGIKAYESNQFDHAIHCFTKCIEDDPDTPIAYVYLAFIAAEQGLIEDSDAFIAHAQELEPMRHDFLAALGEVFLKAGSPKKAEEYLSTAVRLQPDLFPAYPSLAEAMRQNGQIEAAISLLQSAALVSSPTQKSIFSFLFELLTQRGDIHSLGRCCQQRQDMVSRSLAILLASRGPTEPETILNGLREFEKLHLPALRLNPAKQTESPLITLAFLVSDLKRESALGRLEALLNHLPPEHYRTVIIDNDCNPTKVNDIGTQRMFLVTDHWIQIDTLNDAEAIEFINQLPPIDILIDTDGVAAHHRLSMFYELMATRKASWGRLSIPNDEVIFIAGTSLETSYAKYYPTSKRIHLPRLGNCTNLPEIHIQPTRSCKERRFACLTPVQCVDESSWRVFAEVLKRSTTTTLTVNLGKLSQDAQDYVTHVFADEGVAAERLRFVNATSEEEICHAWNQVDIGLAPIGDSGELVLAACLWMGRPFVAFTSDAPWSGQPGALLESLGFANLIAYSLEDYLEKALVLIDSPPPNGLRELLIASQPSSKELAIAFEASLQNIQWANPA